MTPEEMLMDVCKGAPKRGLSAVEIIEPWVKLLWESYRTVLDILRNNAKLEGLYQVHPPLEPFAAGLWVGRTQCYPPSPLG